MALDLLKRGLFKRSLSDGYHLDLLIKGKLAVKLAYFILELLKYLVGVKSLCSFLVGIYTCGNLHVIGGHTVYSAVNHYVLYERKASDLFLKLRNAGKVYSGRGISTDIVGAGIMAYINAVNKIVYEEEEA